jgi:ArsR family transcriptional regulator
MLWMLFNHQELCVCDFMEVLQITQSKASRHMRNLYHAGLVEDRREGSWSYYSLRRFEDPLVRSHMRTLKKSLAEREDLADLLDELSTWLAKKERAGAARCA